MPRVLFTYNDLNTDTEVEIQIGPEKIWLFIF